MYDTLKKYHFDSLNMATKPVFVYVIFGVTSVGMLQVLVKDTFTDTDASVNPFKEYMQISSSVIQILVVNNSYNKLNCIINVYFYIQRTRTKFKFTNL